MKRTLLFLSLLLTAVLLWPLGAVAQEKKYPVGPKVAGFIQADFYAGDDPSATGVDTSFMIRRTRLDVTGQINKLVSYRFMGGFDGANSPTSASSAILFDAWVNLKFDPLFQVKVGQFKYRFDLEGFEGGPVNPFATRAAVVNGIALNLGQTGGFYRDIGIEIHGGQEKPIGWRYVLGVINGNGTNKHDDNSNKDIYLRGEIEPVKGLNFGAGYYSGKVGTGAATSPKTDESAWTVDAQYAAGPFLVRGAYYRGDYDFNGGTGLCGTAGGCEPEGWYVMGSYRVLPNLDLLLRYQVYDSDTNLANRQFDSFDIGLNYYFDRKGTWGGTKLALNYMFRDAEASATSRVWEERGASVTGAAVGNAFIARLQVVF